MFVGFSSDFIDWVQAHKSELRSQLSGGHLKLIDRADLQGRLLAAPQTLLEAWSELVTFMMMQGAAQEIVVEGRDLLAIIKTEIGDRTFPEGHDLESFGRLLDSATSDTERLAVVREASRAGQLTENLGKRLSMSLSADKRASYLRFNWNACGFCGGCMLEFGPGAAAAGCVACGLMA